MQLVIDISEEDYKALKQGHVPFAVLDVIMNGTPIPKGNEYAKEQTSWIPVSERLPNHDEYIKNNGLFNVSDGNRSYSEWFDIYDKQMFGEPTMSGFRVDYAITAWMPLPESYREMTRQEEIEHNKTKQLLDELSKMSPMVISTAYLYAINYITYGVDVTEKWLTATENAANIERAYKDGYYDALKRPKSEVSDTHNKHINMEK